MFFGKMGHRQGRWEGLFDKSKRIRDRRMRLYMCTSPLRARDTLPQFYITCYISNISNDHLLLSVEKIKILNKLKQPCHKPTQWIDLVLPTLVLLGPILVSIRRSIFSNATQTSMSLCPIPIAAPFRMRCHSPLPLNPSSS